MVKNKTAFALIFIYLFSITELCQLLKTPVLLQHYSEHCLQHPGSSFLDYLNDHYVEDDGNEADNATDARLPFKDNNPAGSAPGLFCAPCPDCVQQALIPPAVAGPVLSNTESFLLPAFSNNIWQPPKQAALSA